MPQTDVTVTSEVGLHARPARGGPPRPARRRADQGRRDVSVRRDDRGRRPGGERQVDALRPHARRPLRPDDHDPDRGRARGRGARRPRGAGDVAVSVLAGIAASPGSCVAAAFRHDPAALELPTGTVADPTVEASALEAALEAIAGELDTRAADASGPLAEVLSAQALMARDPELLGGAREMIAAGAPAA